MTPRTPSEEALWNAVCAAEFVRQFARYHADSGRDAWPGDDLRAVMMHEARVTADWAVQAARDCDGAKY